MTDRPRLLIEEWLPLAALGAESMRERGASSALPPLYFLHVWWARRPLIASRAAVLASLLPAWSAAFPAELKKQFPTPESYQVWFRHLCGIYGEPEKARKMILQSRASGKELDSNPYEHLRAFRVNPSPEMMATMRDLLVFAWGTSDLSVVDPFSGGGSIPFESMRYGFETVANELNPVAAVILKATLEYPMRFGRKLADDVKRYGDLWSQAVAHRLQPFFSHPEGDRTVFAYLWARTVRCPYTGKRIPLAPNWWLRRGSDPVAVLPIFDPDSAEPRFELVQGRTACERIDPDLGTIRKGSAISPWAANQIVDGDHIKEEAKSGRLGLALYGIVLKRDKRLEFVTPKSADLRVLEDVVAELEQRLPAWEAKGWVPNEPRSTGRGDWAAGIYGVNRWRDTYSPRQLFAMLTILECYHVLVSQIRNEKPPEEADAIGTLLALAFDKANDYNSLQVTWDVSRQKIRNTFVRHDLAFKWSPAEFDAAKNLIPWAVDQVVDAYTGISKLVEGPDFFSTPVGTVSLTQGTAARLATLPDRSVTAVVTDPPYSDNVMYSELSNYFYVWLKRLVGEQYPEWFAPELTDAENEAVANEARFREFGSKRKALASEDYERKMGSSFREMHRILRNDGVLTVMFTHKEVKAWDTLATALINAGFVIEASWPVATESEVSTHQAKKNAASSTIFLACRKRQPGGESMWWDDLKGKVRRVARAKAQDFRSQGMSGVDLYISTFGPTLAIISEQWPVLTNEVDERTGKPKQLRPETALDLAREEVVSLLRQGLLSGRSMQFDHVTDWYLVAWDTFKAEEFPADEARKLALALGLDLQGDLIGDKRLIAKKADSVVLQLPEKRRKRGMVDPDLDYFPSWIDAAHTAMLLYAEDGEAACKRFLHRTGLLKDETFIACVEALVTAIPRVKAHGKFIRPEAAVLENMRLSFWSDLEPPPEEEVVFTRLKQSTLSFDDAAENEEEDEAE